MRLLTIEALDKIRTELDLLLEHKEIEWQGTLRHTFETYLHPNVIDKESPEIYKMLGEGSVPDLFQFSTEMGLQTAIKVKPKNLLEVASANSLMRLMNEGEGEQPIDTFVRFKNNIKLWYEEMNLYKLTNDEIKIMEEYMLKLNGVADTQEVVMLLTMDERIAGFSVKDANKLRKTIAKKQARADFEERKKEFYEKGNELGTSINLLDYVWKQVERQRGYAFSILHTMAYSIVALQELTLNHRFNKIYWNTAVLSVNAASNDEADEEEDSKNKSTNYGKVASAIGNMKQHGVMIGLPDINEANFGFKPDIKNNQIVFGLKGLNGIGDDTVQTIISNRPYSSFEDFYERMHITGLIKKSQMIQLIKAGCFDIFGSRIDIMKDFVVKVSQPKEKLTMQNFSAIVEQKMLPDEYKFYEKIFSFRKAVMKQTFDIKKIDGEFNAKDKYYLLNSKTLDYFYTWFSDASIVTYHNNYPVISEKIFKKEYDKRMSDIKDWLTSEETLVLFNTYLFKDEWNNLANGTLSKWEMDSLSFYYNEHELKHLNKEKYGISDFNDLPEEPLHAGYFKWKDKEVPKFKIDCIAGTVLDKNKNKHTVTLLTVDGVITVKYQDGQFAFYNKQVSRNKADGKKEILEKSWFTRGNKIVVVGYRRGSQFRAKRYKDTKYQHTTMLIQDVNKNGDLRVIKDRKKV